MQLPGTAMIGRRIGRLSSPVSVRRPSSPDAGMAGHPGCHDGLRDRRGSYASAAAERYLYRTFDNTGARK